MKATERPQEAAARSSAMFLAVFVVLLGLLAALGVVAVWRAYQRRQVSLMTIFVPALMTWHCPIRMAPKIS